MQVHFLMSQNVQQEKKGYLARDKYAVQKHTRNQFLVTSANKLVSQ